MMMMASSTGSTCWTRHMRFRNCTTSRGGQSRSLNRVIPEYLYLIIVPKGVNRLLIHSKRVNLAELIHFRGSGSFLKCTETMRCTVQGCNLFMKQKLMTHSISGTWRLGRISKCVWVFMTSCLVLIVLDS